MPLAGADKPSSYHWNKDTTPATKRLIASLGKQDTLASSSGSSHLWSPIHAGDKGVWGIRCASIQPKTTHQWPPYASILAPFYNNFGKMRWETTIGYNGTGPHCSFGVSSTAMGPLLAPTDRSAPAPGVILLLLYFHAQSTLAHHSSASNAPPPHLCLKFMDRDHAKRAGLRSKKFFGFGGFAVWILPIRSRRVPQWVVLVMTGGHRGLRQWRSEFNRL